MEDAVVVRPAVEAGWRTVSSVFAGPGDQGTCWCQWFRVSTRRLDELGAEGARERLRAEVDNSAPGPGVVAIQDGEPVGWCGVGPTDGYPRLARSPLLRGVAPAAWVVTCFVVPRAHRRRGVARALLDGAVEHARAHDAQSLGAIPVDPAARHASPAELYHGPLPLFLAAGFQEVARPSAGRAVVRLDLRTRTPSTG